MKRSRIVLNSQQLKCHTSHTVVRTCGLGRTLNSIPCFSNKKTVIFCDSRLLSHIKINWSTLVYSCISFDLYLKVHFVLELTVCFKPVVLSTAH